GLNLFAYCGNEPINRADPSGHSAVIIGIILGAIIGVVVGFGVATYIDYKDDGTVFNGSVAWYDYLGAIVAGGILRAAVGASLGYFVDSSASSYISYFYVISSASETSVLQAVGDFSLVGSAGVALGAALMFSKGFGPRIGHNQFENKQFKYLCNKHHLTKDEARFLHEYISHNNYTFREIEQLIWDLFKK
ncbi:MAG: hypothetical protein HUJ68_01745, partial [Clostridia bacterium]|nr:hypothetical protein [Clostridia bacterium]